MKNLTKILLTSSIIFGSFINNQKTYSQPQFEDKDTLKNSYLHSKNDSSTISSQIDYNKIKASALLKYGLDLANSYEDGKNAKFEGLIRDIMICYKEDISCISFDGEKKLCNIMTVETEEDYSVLIDMEKKKNLLKTKIFFDENGKKADRLEYIIEANKKTESIKVTGLLLKEKLTAFYNPAFREIKKVKTENLDEESVVYNVFRKEIKKFTEKIEEEEKYKILLRTPIQKGSILGD